MGDLKYRLTTQCCLKTVLFKERIPEQMLPGVPDIPLPLTMEMKNARDDENKESVEKNDVEMDWFASVKGFNLITSLKANVPISRSNGSEKQSGQETMDDMMMSDGNDNTMANERSDSCSDDSDVVIEAIDDFGLVAKSVPKSLKKGKTSKVKASNEPIEEKLEGSKSKMSCSKPFRCSDCDESFKCRSKLISHQVGNHYYEELENLLVADFLESKVCCKLDFSKTGFGMFIRHKAVKHGAIKLLLSKEVDERNEDSDDDFDN